MADQNRTEKATPQRRKKATEKGQIARSREVSSTLACIAAVGVIVWQLPTIFHHWQSFMRQCITFGFSEELRPTSSVMFWSGFQMFLWSAPVLAAAWGVSVFSSVAQGGLIFAPAALTPNISRLSPAAKVKQIFSITGLSSLLKSVLPFGVIAFLAIQVIRRDWGQVIGASSFGVGSLAHFLGSILFEITWKSLLVLAVWAAFDYFLTYRKHESDLKMSKQEVRQELKDSEGNPTVKIRMRRMQRKVRRKKLLEETEKATVVIVNPTHFAVALQYDVSMAAPIVLAKGRDHLAEEIKQVARWHGIPILENPPLAQALYRAVEVGQSIPSKLYTAVAEILAFVYKAQAQARAEAQARAKAQPTGPSRI